MAQPCRTSGRRKRETVLKPKPSRPGNETDLPGRNVRNTETSLRSRQQLWSNVLNPKAASVYLTLVPQFLTSSRPIAPQIATLAVVHVAIVVVWLLFWTSVVAAARTMIDTPRFRRGMSRLAGAVLIGLGVRTATAR
ncbi:LysE family translocator [Streptomyces mesophilus]|uniref:LysE family translocator n=1 Tax=Streptomyces mesophilus TaxID=1775132 RepID=UPI002E2BCECB|nr:LysE family transporter [Streptomyces mesophilus]